MSGNPYLGLELTNTFLVDSSICHLGSLVYQQLMILARGL